MKKKVLMVSFRCPWPAEKGGYVLRFLNITRILSKNYKVDLLTLVKNQEEKYLDNLRERFDKVIYFRHPKIYEYFGALKAIFSSKPLQVGYYYSPKMKDWIKRNYGNYDLVFCSTVRTSDYVRDLDVKKCIDF